METTGEFEAWSTTSVLIGGAGVRVGLEATHEPGPLFFARPVAPAVVTSVLFGVVRCRSVPVGW